MKNKEELITNIRVLNESLSSLSYAPLDRDDADLMKFRNDSIKKLIEKLNSKIEKL